MSTNKIDRSKYEVPRELRIASSTNYIVPKLKLYERQGLKKHMAKALHTGDFSRYKYPHDESYHHVINLLSTPELSPDELRLGLFLFEMAYEKRNFKPVYCLADEDFRTQKVGENELIHIGKPKSSKHTFSAMPITSLVIKLQNNQIRMDSFNLLPMLEKLESFGVLTMTEICNKNCVNPDVEEFVTNCVYLELNLGFTSTVINRKWM
ncbi:hypothetical protein SAMN05660691_03450 [Rheinheimera pacifica]|uniref:Uncharacterized protein n=1 Tax=Rheinheimera pacifica TaxID=173990 RepID=A0A1H6N9K6_9GAMM|nr:hypothetical protein [Rheinheimera pacifica]SEI08236.1 hypothetical protein SAMN05660691_03450 [Rheinheimera pacifica]